MPPRIISALMIMTSTVIIVTGQNQIPNNCGNCSSTGYGTLTLNCSARGFTSVPNCGIMSITKLFLGNNKISIVKAFDFKHMPLLEYLDLRYNVLTRIENKALSGLDNLVYMNLDGNELGGSSFEGEIFKDVKNLQSLNICGNNFVNNKTLLAHTLSFLSNITTLSFPVQNGFLFGEEFQALVNLKSLYICGVIHLHNNTFVGLAGIQIQTFTITATFVDSGAFVPLKYLTGLTLISDETITKILESLIAFVNKSMHYLDLTNNRYRYEYQTLTTHKLRYISLICVESLILQKDNIQEIEFSALVSFRYKQCLRYLDLSRNYIRSIVINIIPEFPNLDTIIFCCHKNIVRRKRSKHKLEYKIQDIGDVSVTNLSSSDTLSSKIKRKIPTRTMNTLKKRQLYLQHGLLHKFKSLHRETRGIKRNIDGELFKADNYYSTRPSFTFYFNKKLKFLNVSYLNARADDANVTIMDGNSVKVSDLAYNRLTCLSIVKGLPNLETLNISGFHCWKLSPLFLRYFPNLKTFVAMDAQLNIGFQNDKNGNFFLGLTTLEYINLANNDLSILHRGLFSHQAKSLKRLILSGNKLMAFPRIFDKLFVSLLDINLQNNDISYLTVQKRTEINNLIVYSKNDLNIYLKGNTFQCSCTATEMLQWFAMHLSVFKDTVDVLCTNPSGKKVNLQKQIKNLQTLRVICISSFWLIVSICGITVLVIVLITSVIGYRNRIALEFCCLRMKWFLNRYKPLITTHTYDAFIAYSSQDTHWVVHSLRKFLEDDLNLKVCFYGRDFIPSRSIADEIFDGIQESRKIIFVITRDFTESEWMVYELEQTRLHMFRKYREHNVILILKDHIPISELPDIVQTLWSRIVCLEFRKTMMRSIWQYSGTN